MRRFTVEIDIDRPPAEVFAALTDPALTPRLQPGVERVELALPAPPTGPGAGKEDVHLGSLLAVYVAGRKRPHPQRVVEFKPGRVYAVRCEGGVFRTTYRYRLRPLKGANKSEAGGKGASACRARLDAIFESAGPGRLLEPLVARRAHKADADQLAKLKALLERND